MPKDQDFDSKPEAVAGTPLNGKHATSQPQSEITAEPQGQPVRTRPPAPWGRSVSESVARYAARRAAREHAAGTGAAEPIPTNPTTGTHQQAWKGKSEGWGPEACLKALEERGLGHGLLATALREELANPKRSNTVAVTATLIGTPKDHPSREK